MRIEVEQAVDGRWIAEVSKISASLAYGETKYAAISKVELFSEYLQSDWNGERSPQLDGVFASFVV